MSLELPERASHDYLKKLAKERLALMRRTRPATRLADAQLAIARDYGFASWRALKADLDRRRVPRVAAFTRACTAGDLAALRELLQQDPALVRESFGRGATGLHLAARHPAALRLLIAHGAEPKAREAGDLATPLHLAAAHGALESVRVLLDAGADPNDAGDVHHSGVIGWAARMDNRAVVDLLVERGARHHIFSAMALRDRALVERLIEDDPGALSRRRSRFESGHTPLHAAVAPPDGLGFLAGAPDHDMLGLLLDLGADVEAKDDRGRTPLELAIRRGDDEAMRLLRAAGAADPEPAPPPGEVRPLAELAASATKSVPMLRVPDVRATVRWYQSIGFSVVDAYEDDGELVFARLSFGACELTLSPGATTGLRDTSVWIHTARVEELYGRLKDLQRGTGNADGVEPPGIRFEEDLYTPFYGGRQFSLRDINGLMLVYWQPAWL